MRLLHTSDWHLGRSFHGHSTVPQLREVLGGLPEMVRAQRVDVVVVAGDVFDHAAPAAELYELLAWAIRGIREAGAEIVMISGNHDNATRLGFQAEWAALGGVHMLTRPDAFRTPLTLSFHGKSYDFYGIPFLEPMLHRSLFPGQDLRSHAAVLRQVMSEVNAQREVRGTPSVVISHCFAANQVVAGGGAAGDSETGAQHLGGGLFDPDMPEGNRESKSEGDSEAAGEGDSRASGSSLGAGNFGSDAEDPGAGLQWDLTSGGVDLVPSTVFTGPEYVALGHLHGRITLSESIRYSGAPLHFSFGESSKPRGAWLATLSDSRLETVQWIDFPIPRPLARLRGTLDELLNDAELLDYAAHWVEATLTDISRPIDAMRRLREKFPYCARVVLAPDGVVALERRSYASRVVGKTDAEVIDEFLQHVRSGEGADQEEDEILREVLAEVRSS